MTAMMRTRLLVACLGSGAVAFLSAQQAPANKPDTQEVTQMIERLRHDAGPRWTYAVHFWCEEPRANRPDDPPILIGDAQEAHKLLGWNRSVQLCKLSRGFMWKWLKYLNQNTRRPAAQ